MSLMCLFAFNTLTAFSTDLERGGEITSSKGVAMKPVFQAVDRLSCLFLCALFHNP